MTETPDSTQAAGIGTIGIIGDRDPDDRLHLASEQALGHGPTPMAYAWVPTESIGADPAACLAPFAGLLIATSSHPYRSVSGALAAIRYAREQRVPLLGACGGFQHMLLEFVRHVLGVADADHAEAHPDAPRLAVTPLSCSLAGQSHPVRLLAGSRAATLCAAETVVEPFYCSYGLNPDYLAALEAHGFRVAGLGLDGVVRVMELQDHPFFLGTLYVPQARSRPGEQHPLVAGLVDAARRRVLASV